MCFQYPYGIRHGHDDSRALLLWFCFQLKLLLLFFIHSPTAILSKKVMSNKSCLPICGQARTLCWIWVVVRRCVRARMCVYPPICCVVCIIWCAAPHSLLSAIDRPNSQSGADCRIIVTLTYRVPGGWCRLSLEPGGRVIGIYQRWTERRACFVQPERERERERERKREREWERWEEGREEN